jgi:hypothetical protein
MLKADYMGVYTTHVGKGKMNGTLDQIGHQWSANVLQTQQKMMQASPV